MRLSKRSTIFIFWKTRATRAHARSRGGYPIQGIMARYIVYRPSSLRRMRAPPLNKTSGDALSPTMGMFLLDSAQSYLFK